MCAFGDNSQGLSTLWFWLKHLQMQPRAATCPNRGIPLAMKAFFGLRFIPFSTDLGLLMIRLVFPVLMIVFHGWNKLMTASEQLHSFPDLIGIGSELSYLLVVWFEVFGAVSIALGLLTRINALGLAFTMFVAWLLWHGGRFTGEDAGEMAFAYGCVYLLLVFTGPGRFSADHRLGLVS